MNRQVSTEIELEFTRKAPKCLYCSKTLVARICKDHEYYTCSTHEISHQCLTVAEKLQLRNLELVLVPKRAVRVESRFRPIELSKSINNIEAVIKMTHRVFVHSYKFYRTCPLNRINISIDAVVSDKVKAIILENRSMEEYLPLCIQTIS